jgi:F-type H+-transporting ATPase subunit gamma
VPSLKDFRIRISSVKNTRKITSAMKMVAASKLRQAQARAEAGRPYASKMEEALARLILAIGHRSESIPLLDGTGRTRRVLYIVVAADRGLCGGFNGNMVREVRRHITSEVLENREITILTIGRKARDLLKRDYPKFILGSSPLEIKYSTAEQTTKQVIDLFDSGKFDTAYIAYSQFKNVMTQAPTVKQIIPFQLPEKIVEQMRREEESHGLYNETAHGIYSFEPDAMTLLQRLIPQQIAAQIYSVLLEVGAGEQAARMTAMDNATRNAGDMINRLTLQYNRARQAYITKEVSEIVSGAEASG